jgi:hypothetical protein
MSQEELKQKFAQKMLDENLDFLPLEESLQLADCDINLDTRFSWVINVEELGTEDRDYDEMTTEELLGNYREVFGDSDCGLKVGNSDQEFSEFTMELAPAPTYIDLIK